MPAAPILRRPPILSAGRGLGLLCDGLDRALLGELALHGPLTRAALVARLHAGATRVYESLRRLRDAGLTEASEAGRAARHSITDSGRGLLAVAAPVRAWFGGRPGGALEPSVGWRAFAEIGEAWRDGLIEWIVRTAPGEADLDHGPPGYERRRLAEVLARMGEAGTLAPRRGADGRAHHRLSPWAARAIGPLAALARWEERFGPPGGARIATEDAVVAILATLPLVRLDPGLGGVCTLTVEAPAPRPGAPRTGTVWARLRGGRPLALGEGAPPRPAEAWARGSFADWLAAALDGRPGALRLGAGGAEAAALLPALLGALHAELAG
jgi:hypothetical protein